MGNTQTIHFQANHDLKTYRWFKLRKSDVNVMQIDNEVMERFKLQDQKEELTFTVSFLPKDGDWLLLDKAEDIESMYRLCHGKGTKKSPISLQVKLVPKD
jgi:hypothetical protein